MCACSHAWNFELGTRNSLFRYTLVYLKTFVNGSKHPFTRPLPHDTFFSRGKVLSENQQLRRSSDSLKGIDGVVAIKASRLLITDHGPRNFHAP